MGGIISKQGLADRAANYKFHPLRKKSEKNSLHESNDRVITDCTPSAKLLDNSEGENKDDHRSPNSDRNPQNIDSISPTPNTLQTSEINSERNTQSISAPHESISPTTNTLQTSEINSDKNTRSISSPRESISPTTNAVHTSEKNSARSISSPCESISTTATNMVQLQTSEVNSNKNPQSISSPLKSISPTKTVSTSENNSKLEQKESVPVSDSDNNTPRKKGQEEDDLKVESDYHDKSDDDYGRRISERHSDYDGWVGSPSFREYCVKDHLKPDSSTYDGEKIETKGKVIKANEDPTPASTKKGRTSRRIKKVISMGNPSAMGKLFNVSACYSPGNAASHDKLAKPIEKNVETK